MDLTTWLIVAPSRIAASLKSLWRASGTSALIVFMQVRVYRGTIQKVKINVYACTANTHTGSHRPSALGSTFGRANGLTRYGRNLRTD